MMGLKTLLLVSLLGVLALRVAAGSHHGLTLPGAPYNVSENDPGLQQAVLDGTYFFNNQSNDAFLFKPSTIHRAQRQVVKGVRYIVDLEISRTICHKRDNKDLSNCDFQPEGRLHQTFQCHCEVWVIPWLKEIKTEEFSCKS